jgi:hypothetical protein
MADVQEQPMTAIARTAPRPSAPGVRLVTRDGRRIPVDAVPAVDAPEAILAISFDGLTEAEQRAALAAFPGGRRFKLVRAG